MLSNIGRVATSLLMAAFLGVGTGALFAYLAPQNKFSWAGLAMVPLWLLLEAFLAGTVAVLGAPSRLQRIASTTVLLGGFYLAWFGVRGAGP